MKFFLDENIPLLAVDTFHEFGFEAEHARDKLRGATDKAIAEYARKQKAILVTKDLEFGSLVLYAKGTHYGLLVIRLPHYFTAEQIITAIKTLLKKIKPEILVNSITVLETGRYRIRSL